MKASDQIALIISVGPQGLPELQQAIFYSNRLLVLVGLKDKVSHMPELVEIDGPKFVLENLDNLFLEKPNKLKGNVGDLGRDFTLNFLLLFFTSLGPRPLGLTFTTGCRNVGCNDLGL